MPSAAAIPALIAAAIGIVPAAASEVRQLRIATWTIVAADPSWPEQSAVEAEPAPASRSYRHTFGAERRSPPERSVVLDAAALEADAVLLQGVPNSSALRRLFPSGQWTVIISRRRADDVERNAVVAAIAVRASGGVRIRRQQHLIPRADEADGGPAAVAVQLSVGEQRLWLVSPSQGECAGMPGHDCRSAEHDRRLREWLDQIADRGDAIVVGGMSVRTAGEPGGTAPHGHPAPGSAREPPPARGTQRQQVTGDGASARLFVPPGEPSCGRHGAGGLAVLRGASTRLQVASQGWIVPVGRRGGSDGCALVLDLAMTPD